MFRNIHIHKKRTVYFIPNFSSLTYTFYNQCTLNNNILQSDLSSAITYPKYNKYRSTVSAASNTYVKQ